MMKMTIRVKLLLIIMIANTALVLAIYIANKVAFEKSFTAYLENTARSQLQNVVTQVAQTYARHGSLDWVYRGSEEWDSIVHHFYGLSEGERPRDRLHTRPPPRPRERNEAGPRRRDGPPPRLNNKKRLLIKDPQGNIIMGTAQSKQTSLWFPVYQSDHLPEPKRHKIIAYLGVEQSGFVRNEFDQLFAEQQRKQFIVIALVALLITVIIAVPFSKYMVNPIVLLRRNAKTLAQGNYDARVMIASKDELGLLARDMNRLADTLAQNQIARQQWIADISHELRTPIAVIRAELEGMIDGVIASEPEQLMSLNEEIQRLTRLVDDLHQLSLSDRGALTYNMGKENLYDLLARTFAKRSHQIEKQHFNFALLCDEHIEIECDEQRLSQLFDNLLQNTLRYTDSTTEQPGNIQVQVTQQAEKITICWQDSAPSVKPEQLDKLFDRLYRVEEARDRKTGGSGLGLAICQSIVAAHNGKISADLSELGGLAIIIELKR
ncbi:ATP-binding protein [Pseudoalteromonas piscicida]|uniref:ATP-binding protein n=1 Tax=Pseudoalteromonas piscicida TaxID=43662 RepID=UPI0030B07FA9